MEEDSYTYIFLLNVCIILLVIFLLSHNLHNIINDSKAIYKQYFLKSY